MPLTHRHKVLKLNSTGSEAALSRPSGGFDSRQLHQSIGSLTSVVEARILTPVTTVRFCQDPPKVYAGVRHRHKACYLNDGHVQLTESSPL